MTQNAICTALVVDDEPAITDLLSYILSEEGMCVYSAQDAYAAIDILDNTTVDVVITDIRMEGMSGFDLLSHINDTDDNIKVIMITGYDSYDMIKKALRANAYDYIKKPLSDHEEVVSTVKRAHESSRLLRENSNLIKRLQASNTKASTANKRLLQLNKQLRKLATTDSLTQLANRRYVDDLIQTFAFSNTTSETPYSIALLDVDHFKKVNDTYGHDAGDVVLRHLAKLLTGVCRSQDIIGRYGGEEFIVVMPDTDAADAWQLAERIRTSIQESSINTSEGSVKTTVSVGVSTSLASPDSKNTNTNTNTNRITSAEAFLSGRSLVGQADKALYCAKDDGRNACVHFSNIDNTQNTKKRLA